MAEPDNLVLPLLREIRADMSSMRVEIGCRASTPCEQSSPISKRGSTASSRRRSASPMLGRYAAAEVEERLAEIERRLAALETRT